METAHDSSDAPDRSKFSGFIVSSITGLEARHPVLESSSSTSAADPSGPNQEQRRASHGGSARVSRLSRMGARVRECLLRGGALELARGQQLGVHQRGALRGALQALELADRAVDLPEGYSAGPPLGATLMLYQEAVWWALQALADGGTEQPESLAQACARHTELLSTLAGGEQALAQLRAQLLEPERHSFQALDQASQLALTASARRFAGALIAHLGAPDERLSRIERERWLRPLLALTAAAGVVLALVYVFAPKDVAVGKSWVASSSDWGFEKIGSMDKFGNEDLLFHTNREDTPWVIIDLGAFERVRGIEVENRGSCCQERAVPLIVELSTDGNTWQEVARRKKKFQGWETRFRPQSARFVRLRVPRKTVFHLRRVRVLS